MRFGERPDFSRAPGATQWSVVFRRVEICSRSSPESRPRVLLGEERLRVQLGEDELSTMRQWDTREGVSVGTPESRKVMRCCMDLHAARGFTAAASVDGS